VILKNFELVGRCLILLQSWTDIAWINTGSVGQATISYHDDAYLSRMINAGRRYVTADM
jgi:hypothetical protein